jgi:hypothetical protein
MASSNLVILLLALAIRLTKVKSLAKRVVVLAKEIALHQWPDIIKMVPASCNNAISPVKLALIALAVLVTVLLVLLKEKT